MAWLGLTFATLLALVLRAWGWSTIGIDHFDEGVYAFTGLAWSDTTLRSVAYPDQILFSPPIYPFLISLAYRLLGPTVPSAVAVNLVLGVTSVLVVGLIARRWFGNAAGSAAALLVATDPLHVMLSRSALTDVAFLLLFVLAIAAAVEALRTKAWSWAIAAGALTGLAWNTKYHGWFVLLIAGWGLLAGLWESRRERPELVRLGLLWGLMAGVAFVCYLPWAFYVEAEMGYRSLLAYQRTNAAGSPLGNVLQQVGQQAILETSWSRIGPAFAATAVLMTLRPVAWTRGLGTVLGLGAIGVLAGQGFVVLSLLLAALVVGVRKGAPPEVWLLAGWTTLWLASAPLYDPYARLLLPLWIAASIGSGWALSRWMSHRPHRAGRDGEGVPTPAARAQPSLSRSALVFAGCILLGGSITAGVLDWRDPGGPWRPADAMERAATALAGSIPEGDRVVVLAEPELAFYLHQMGRPADGRTDLPEEVAAIPDTVFLVAGRYVRHAPYLRDNILGALADRLEVIDTVAVVPRDLRVLDDMEPTDAREYLSGPSDVYDVILFRLYPQPRS